MFDYFAGGSGREVTLDEATAAWLRYRLVPRVLVDVSRVVLSTSLLGVALPSPVAVAPVAYQGLLHGDGEQAMVAGAGPHLTIVSTRASRTIESIAAAATGPWWFQVYVTADAALSTALALRAAAAGAGALVLTGDTPYIGRKARTGRPVDLGGAATMANFAQHLAPGADPARATEQSPAASLDDIGRLAATTGLPVLVKGVLSADDAHRCLDAGAAGVIVSTHGGRQLDRAVSTAEALPAVVAAAQGAPVLVDGGIRSGLDALVALALGADAVLLGRPAAWALAHGGAPSVTALLEAMDDELSHVLALAGCPDLTSVTADLLHGRGTTAGPR